MKCCYQTPLNAFRVNCALYFRDLEKLLRLNIKQKRRSIFSNLSVSNTCKFESNRCDHVIPIFKEGSDVTCKL